MVTDATAVSSSERPPSVTEHVAMLDAVAAPILLVDDNHQIVHANPDARELGALFAATSAALTTAELATHDGQLHAVASDGRVRWFEPRRRAAAEHLTVITLHEITARREQAEQRETEAIRARALAAEAQRREAERARSHLAAILESITDPFSVLDDQLRIVHLNEAGARLIGRPASEVIGRKPWEVIPGGEDTPLHAAYRRVLETHEPLSVEDYFAPWDRWYEASIYPLGEGISVYTRDVTVRKRAFELTARLGRHAALRAEISATLADERDMRRMLERACAAIVDQLDAAFARVWTVDDAGTTLLLQASAGVYTHVDGPHRAVPIGRFKIGRIAASHRPHLTNDVLHDPQIGDPAWARREGMVAFAGYPLLVDGKLIGVLALFSRHALPEDTSSVLGTIADLVAQGIVRRRTELELEQRLADLARSNADLEQFAYVASHDLQEPLRMVASYNQLLARRYKGKLDADADEFIGYTVEGVTRMQRLINDLLAYSRVGRRDTELAPVDLEKVLATVTCNLERAAAEAGAEITHDPLPEVMADEGQMVQLMQNLIGNSIKFRGEAPPRIHVGARRDPRGVTISIQDNGIGIEPQFFERIFVIFQRLNPREHYPGTGIGLAICKKIVERHGGRIWVESRPGEGATISFRIPTPRNLT
jgi:PAS domain S-box-containing protein